MAEDSNAWVFDSLICFLHGPIWNAPLQTFIEEKSLIFDPNEKLDEHNDEYRKVHDEYKHLVDFMLGSFMEEMQITPEQFEVAVLAGKQNPGGTTLPFHQGLFQQIWAANDIRIFARMMTQRNVELQLQALDVIERRHMNSTANSRDDEALDLAVQKHGSEVKEEDVITQEEIEKIVIEENERSEEEPPKTMLPPDIAEAAGASSSAAELDDGDGIDVTEKLQRLNLYFERENPVDSADIRKRQEYLRAQRDKILAIKKRVRANQLGETTIKGGHGRPTSARAAQRLLQSDGQWNVEPMESSLLLRKTLAQRLRNEVVDSKTDK